MLGYSIVITGNSHIGVYEIPENACFGLVSLSLTAPSIAQLSEATRNKVRQRGFKVSEICISIHDPTRGGSVERHPIPKRSG